MHENYFDAFPKKILLSGEDYFYLVLESNIKQYKTGNNTVRIYFVPQNEADLVSFLAAVKSSYLLFYLNNLKLRKGNLFRKPSWIFENKLFVENEISIHKHEIENEIPFSILNRKINLDADNLISFDVIKFPSNTSMIVFSWHHILMDGKGASLFLKHIYDHEFDNISSFFPPVKEKINLFKQLINLNQMKEFIRKQNKNIEEGYSVLSSKERCFYSDEIVFTREESEQIKLNGFRAGSKFGVNHFLLACCLYAYLKLPKNKSNSKNYWIPIPYDGRKRGAIGPIITNSISFVFYRVSHKDCISVASIVSSLNKQLKMQIQKEISPKFLSMLDVMRHLPLGFYRFLVKSTSSKTMSPFLFSSSGDTNWELEKSINFPLNDISVFAPFSYPPGIVFSALQFDRKIKLRISYADLIFSEEEIVFLKKELRQTLLQIN